MFMEDIFGNCTALLQGSTIWQPKLDGIGGLRALSQTLCFRVSAIVTEVSIAEDGGHRQFNELKAKRLPGSTDQAALAMPVTSVQT
ncbi:hypothetical protein DC522_19160 [Microvirga sp. KLBC 81]|nr:hypothetical protein DC522_19160 [Microvirga sp. KLBC 81]